MTLAPAENMARISDEISQIREEHNKGEEYSLNSMFHLQPFHQRQQELLHYRNMFAALVESSEEELESPGPEA